MDADIVAVDPQYVPQVEALNGVVVHKNLPGISMNPVMIFGSDLVTDGNDLVGNGHWGEQGIDSTFFNDVHVRRGLSFCFDQEFFIEEAYGAVGGFRTHGPVPQAFEWAYNPDPALLYDIDLAKAEEEFRAAHGGRIWDEGFTFTLVYNEGNDARRAMAEMLEYNVESLNPKFHIELLGMPWSSMLDELTTNKMPITLIGWLMDYPDPHNFAMPFCQSVGGVWAEYQGETLVQFYRDNVDPLIQAAMQTTDQAKRAELYYEISRLVVENATYLWMPQVNGYRVVRDYIQGWAFHPAFPDPYFYSIHKTYTEDF
jgi:peptide/nickel transport system substrate-binding protein